MRSCIYCGRELKDGEVCNCPAATARRAAKNGAGTSGTGGTNGARNTNETNNNGYYRTGYTNTGKTDAKRTRKKTKAAEKRNRPKRRAEVNSIFSYIMNFIKSPIESVLNPRNFSTAQMLLIALIQGAVLGLGVFFVATGASRSWFRALAGIMGFAGIRGYQIILSAVACLLSGAAAGLIFFALYVGIFYLINRYIFRMTNTFREMAQKLVLTTIPCTAITLVGVLISFFSTTTLMILMLSGWFISLILTYTALDNEWGNVSSTKSLYCVALGYFVLFTIAMGILRATVI